MILPALSHPDAHTNALRTVTLINGSANLGVTPPVSPPAEEAQGSTGNILPEARRAVQAPEGDGSADTSSTEARYQALLVPTFTGTWTCAD